MLDLLANLFQIVGAICALFALAAVGTGVVLIFDYEIRQAIDDYRRNKKENL